MRKGSAPAGTRSRPTGAIRRAANREALRSMLTLGGDEVAVRRTASPTKRRSRPDAYTLDAALLARPGNDEIQLDLFLDYASNVALYPKFQAVLPHASAAAARGLGQERPVLPAGRRRGLRARQPERAGAAPGHRPLRARNPWRGDRGRHRALPRPDGRGLKARRRRLVFPERARHVGGYDGRPTARRKQQRRQHHAPIASLLSARSSWPPSRAAPA